VYSHVELAPLDDGRLYFQVFCSFFLPNVSVMPSVLYRPSDLCQCSLFGVGKDRFSTNCGDYIVGALSSTTVTDRTPTVTGKEPYSAPIVTQVPGRTEATEEISSNVDVREKVKHRSELF